MGGGSLSTAEDQLSRLADAIALRVGPQRFSVWFSNSTRLDLRSDSLEIAVPNDFISEWISKNFSQPIQEAAHEVLGIPLTLRFSVVPELFEVEGAEGDSSGDRDSRNGKRQRDADGNLTAASRAVQMSRPVAVPRIAPRNESGNAVTAQRTAAAPVA